MLTLYIIPNQWFQDRKKVVTLKYLILVTILQVIELEHVLILKTVCAFAFRLMCLQT